MSAAIPPKHPLSPDNYSPVVTVFTVISACFSAVAALTRVHVTLNRNLRFHIDDALYFAAFAFAIAQTVLFTYAAYNGLGRHMSKLSMSEITMYFKLVYAGRLVGLSLSTTLSKASVAELYRRVLCQRASSPAYLFLIGLVAAWGLFSLFALALQCRLPDPWRFIISDCPNADSLFYAVIIANIVSDVIVALYIVPKVWRLSMWTKDRLVVLVLFGARLLVCIPEAFHFFYATKAMDATDQTWVNVSTIIWESVVVHVSLIAATLPRVHSYIAGFQAGLLDFHIEEAEYARTRPVPERKRSLLSWRWPRRGTEGTGVLSQRESGPPLSLVPENTHSSYITYIYAGTNSVDDKSHSSNG